eukprot:Selendium_serpulae@DN3574_c0_g1_i2.p3
MRSGGGSEFGYPPSMEMINEALANIEIGPEEPLPAPEVGAEDAYVCDETETGNLKPIRIHVYPRGILRTFHIETTVFLLTVLIAFSVVSMLYNLFMLVPSDDNGMSAVLPISPLRNLFCSTNDDQSP